MMLRRRQVPAFLSAGLWICWGTRAAAAPQAAHEALTAEAYGQVRYSLADGGADLVGIRRAKVMLTLLPAVGWRAYAQALYKEGNHSTSDGRLWLQEFWVQRRTGGGSVTLGQVKPPFGMERFTSDWTLDTPDRSQATDRLIPNGGLPRSFARDFGVVWDAGDIRRGWAVAAGAFLGNGALVEPYHHNGPLLAARAIRRWTHGGNWLQVGAAASTRHDRHMDFSNALPGTRSLGTNDFTGRDTRWGAEVAVRTGEWQIRGEWLSARLTGAIGQSVIVANGWYVQTSCALSRSWQGVVKVEGFDPNTAVADAGDLHWTTIGLNYRIHGDREKVQMAYVLRNRPSGNVLVVQYQRFFSGPNP